MKKAFAYLMLILLFISAIPNFFGEKPALVLRDTENSITVNLEEVQQLLTNHNIHPTELSIDESEMLMLFESQQDQRNAQQLLIQHYPEKNTFFSYLSSAPDFFNQIGLSPVNLGLDLRGGVQFVLHVEVDNTVDTLIENTALMVVQQLRTEKIRTRVSLQDKSGLTFIIQNPKSVSPDKLQISINTLRKQYDEWEIKVNKNEIEFTLPSQLQEQYSQLAMQQTLTIMRQRIESLGITEAVTQRQGHNRILIELPGVQDPEAAKRIIGATATISFHSILDPGVPSQVHFTTTGEMTRLSRTPILTGDSIVDASASTGEFGQSEVNLVLSSAGGSKMSEFSRKNIGQPMATLYSEYHKSSKNELIQNHKVINIATIQSQLGNRFRITGIGQLSDAQELALILRSGSLTVPVTIIDEQVIGPSLGAENIEKGLLAFIIGLILTLISMLALYRKFGLIACGALLVNLVMIIGLLSLIPGATLTLPGIAGLVLTMGMAVDTNVLVFERIKEEQKLGRSLKQAITNGYREASTTIIDANLTSMITAIILFAIGYGAIKGFAITLAIGLLTSMFTGLILSKMWMMALWGKKDA